MGNDGGSIPKRRELVKEAARNPTTAEVKEAQQEQQEYHWTTDPISIQPLAAPIVSDCNGTLYNKDTILEFLIEGSRAEEAKIATRGAVKSLKDVVEVKFTTTEDLTAAKPNANGVSIAWKCPITDERLGPGSKAVYLVPCGHAFSGTAIKEVSIEKCTTCDTEYASNDIIPILPTSELDIARLSLRMKTLQGKGLTHSLKKASGSKKRKKNHDSQPDTPTAISNGHEPTSRTSTPVNGGKPRTGTDTPTATTTTTTTSGINDSSTAALTAKVLREQEVAKKRKLDNENVRSLFSSRDQSKPDGRSADFMTRGFSIGTK